MKNTVKCGNCNNENEYYLYTCKNCKAFLRTKVTDLNFWETIWQLIESPKEAFLKITYSEHKNYIIILSILVSIKLFISTLSAKSIINPSHVYDSFVTINWILTTITFIVMLLLVSYLTASINKATGNKILFKDTYAIYVYSLFPLLISLFFLFPIEFALLGKYWLNFNPPPHLFKPTVAYVLYFLELVMFLWSGFLAVSAGYSQTKNKIYSAVAAFVYLLLIISFAIFIPLYPF